MRKYFYFKISQLNIKQIENKYIMKKSFIFRTLFLSLFLFTNFIFAQLVLTVTPTPETCTGNGVLSWTISGKTPGSVVTYEIFKAPNFATPINTTSGMSVTVLLAGAYRVTAVETIGGSSTRTSKDATITNGIVNLVYTTTIVDEVCGNDGKITANVTAGSPVSYELLTGPIIRAPQASNVFLNLVAGIYTVRVTDSCGDAVSVSVTIKKYTSNFTIDPPSLQPVLVNCNTIKVFHTITTVNPGDVLKYPLQYKFTVHPPGGGADIVLNYSYTFGGGGMQFHPAQVTASTGGFQFDLPYYANQSYSYDLEITDPCGKKFTRNNNVIFKGPQVILSGLGSTCSQKYLNVKANYFTSPVTMTLTAFPAAYTGPTSLSVSSATYTFNGSFGSPTDPLPQGSYTVNVTDACGNTQTQTINITNRVLPLNFIVNPGCGAGNASFYWYNASDVFYSTAKITAAPASFPHALPYDVTANITGNKHYLVIEDVPAGTYTVEVTDVCNIVRTSTVIVPGFTGGDYNGTAVNKLCSSFNIQMENTGNNGSSPRYWLQKLDPLTGNWTDPATGTVNGVLGLTNHANNGSFPYSGTFRIINTYTTVTNGGQSYNFKGCVEVIKQFTINYGLELENIYSFPCSGGKYDVVVQVKDGVLPIDYSITTKDGAPFVVNNGTSNIFTNLSPGVYNFRISDGCGNILNRLVDITKLQGLKIDYNNLCIGQNGSLSVPNVPGFTFSWWKEGAPANILSTTNQLNFSPFTAADAGKYHVDIATTIPGSCIASHLTFTIPANPSAPNAGNDQTINISHSVTSLDLNDYLSVGADTYGDWEEITSSGQLLGSLWYPSVAPPGTYKFKYTVRGLCAGEDAVIITINSIDPCAVTPTNPDSDGDGISDFCDLDDDNDGILDTAECPVLFVGEDKGTFGTSPSAAAFYRDLQNAPGGDYVYGPGTNGNAAAGNYTVANQEGAHLNHAGNLWEFPGHTTGLPDDNYLLVNGSTTVGTFFKEDVVLTSGGSYVYGMWHKGAWAQGNAGAYDLKIEIRRVSDNLLVGSFNTGPIPDVLWRQATISFTVPTTEAYRFSLINTSVQVFGNDFSIDDITLNDLNCMQDTDGDGIPDRLDLDSDNDGCLDAIEGDENVTTAQLVNAGGTVSVGTGSTAQNQNLCASGTCVDSQGVPIVVNSGGAADIGGDQGQGVGSSQNAAINVCFCYDLPNTTTTGPDTKHGITLLQRAGVDNGNWPMIRKSAHTALESNTKGFVITRMTTAQITAIVSPQEGMMVYDTVAKCLKLYDGTAWSCFSTPACP